MTPAAGDYVKHKKPSSRGHYRGLLAALLPPTTKRPRVVRARVEWLGNPTFHSVVALDNLELLEPGGRRKDGNAWPEHEKQAQVTWLSQYLGEFLSFLGSQGLCVAREVNTNDDKQHPEWDHWTLVRESMTDRRIRELLGEFFGVDQAKIDQEKDEMLAQIRRANLEREQRGRDT